MLDLVTFAAATHKMWYLLPLLVSVSLVYAATRHELIEPILIHAARFAVWVLAFMAAIFVLIYYLSRGL